MSSLFHTSDMLLRFETRAAQRPNFALLRPCKNKGGMGKISESILRAIIYAPAAVSRFLICWFVWFGSRSASKSTDVENRGKISHFLTPPPVKIRRGVLYRWNVWVTPRTQSIIYFWRDAGGPSRRVKVAWRKRTEVKYEVRSTVVERP